MEKITFSTSIKAEREKVWNTMLEKDSYQEWTATFHEGSTYVLLRLGVLGGRDKSYKICW